MKLSCLCCMYSSGVYLRQEINPRVNHQQKRTIKLRVPHLSTVEVFDRMRKFGEGHSGISKFNTLSSPVISLGSDVKAR
ncbi:hypothetical protein ABKN59_011948 [Abortiporus biennis]